MENLVTGIGQQASHVLRNRICTGILLENIYEIKSNASDGCNKSFGNENRFVNKLRQMDSSS